MNIKTLIGASALLTLTAFALSLYIFKAGQANAMTFSYMGEANRTWFFLYSLAYILAFCLNIIIFTIKSRITSRRLLALMYILLGLTFVFSLLQSVIIAPDFHALHIFLAGTFTAFGCLALITAIAAVLLYNKCKQGYYYMAMIVLTGGMNFYAISAYGWLIASYQWIFAVTVLATSSALAHTSDPAKPEA